MCVLAFWLAVDPATPLVVGANRDEAYARASAPPAEREPGIVAGLDLVHGGTWIGYTRAGLFVAVTNRRVPAPTPASFSRGLLALEALRSGSLAGVGGVVARRAAAHHLAGFNLVAIAGHDGISVHFDGVVRTVPIRPGAHVMSSDYDLDDTRMPEKAVFDRFAARLRGVPNDASLAAFLASHDGARPICKHGVHFGTVSSTMLFFDARGVRALYADGAPCRAAFSAVAG